MRWDYDVTVKCVGPHGCVQFPALLLFYIYLPPLHHLCICPPDQCWASFSCPSMAPPSISMTKLGFFLFGLSILPRLLMPNTMC
uniref:Uncharacterized protein n=1 Tax=Picea sitchensis TaxID=3332 RepID=D5ADA2_PICSI|nr:unknown [Picea sitchensis]